MRGTHPRQHEPQAATVYAAVLDVGGEDEAAHDVLVRDLERPGRDFTACHIVAVDLGALHDPLVGRPRYRVVETRAWHGTRVAALLGQLRAFLLPWGPRFVVADATGVGQGLVSTLAAASNFGERVVPFVFTALSKARLGSAFLSVVETGRFHYYADDDEDARVFWRECAYCAYSIPEGEGAIDRRLRWGVPDGQRDAATGEPVHDDRLIAAALVAVLDEQTWQVYHGGGSVTDGRPVGERLDEQGF